MTPEQAYAALTELLKAAQPVETERAILKARVETDRSVEKMIDKNLKVDTLQLEPVSMVVRSLGRLMATLGGSNNLDAQAAARLTTVTDERALENYDAQREGQAARLRLAINGKLAERSLLKENDPQLAVKEISIDAAIDSLKAGLLAIGGEIKDPAAGTMPSNWSDLQRRLSEAAKNQVPVKTGDAPAVPEAEVVTHELQSGAGVRYDYANQTIGHTHIGESFVEGWIEVRLKNPNTPPEVLLQLSQLAADRAAQTREAAVAGAAGQASVLAAEFKSDVRLWNWAKVQIANPGGGAPSNEFMRGLKIKIDGERRQIASLLGVPMESNPDVKAEEDPLIKLALESGPSSPTLPNLGLKLIDDIRTGQIDTIRRTLFERGLPSGLGGDVDVLSQIDAKTVGRLMTYKGMTPVAAVGMFRGTPVASGFFEGPDPRLIERALENVISDALRKQMESDGQMRDLSLHLHQLMSQVSDGANELEAQRHQIEAAEGELKARTAQASNLQAPEVVSAQQRLLEAWSQFDNTMVGTKTAFISLVTELQALGETSGGTLRPFEEGADKPSPRALRPDTRSQLVDYWTQRMSDPGFAASQDALLAQLGAAAPSDVRARILAAADLYRQALKDGEAVRSNDFSGTQKLDLLTRNDAEGKRLLLRAAIEVELSNLGALDGHTEPADKVLEFFRRDVEKSAAAGTADFKQKRDIANALRTTFIGAMDTKLAVGAAFDRLEKLEKILDDRRELLMTSYLTDKGNDPKDFVLKDAELDDYLKAQTAFDAELTKTMGSGEFKDDATMLRMLDGMYDLKACLDRSVDQARSGRGMAAMDALIMLEETRLRAARWGGSAPAEIDRVAEALQSLRDMKADWADKTKDAGLEPLYALTRVGTDDARTWSVGKWMTLAEVKSHPKEDISVRGDKTFIKIEETVKDQTGKSETKKVEYELVGGVDAAQAQLSAATKDASANTAYGKIAELMTTKGADFVSVGAVAGDELLPLNFDKVFGGKDSEFANGRLFFFSSDKDGKALNPVEALSLPPERVVIMDYRGGQPLPHDLFPSLKSIADSEEANNFRRLAVSPSGAAELASRARAYGEAQLRRGWIEIKLNSHGFALDKNGRVAQLYRTKDDFSAQWKAFEHVKDDLANAETKLGQPAGPASKVATGAYLDEADRKKEADSAQADYNAKLKAFTVARAALEASQGPNQKGDAKDRMEAAAKAVTASGRSDGPEKADFDAAVRAYNSAFNKLPEKKALDEATKAQKEADKRYKDAWTRRVNAEAEVADLKETRDHSENWTLYRAEDLDLSLSDKKVVHVSAKAALAPKGSGGGALDQDISAGARVDAHLKGELSAVVIDEDGRALHSYSSSGDVDRAASKWSLMSLSTDEKDLQARFDDGGVKKNVRLSHYEEDQHPVLLSERYLIERLDASRSKLSSADHWAIMPYNWGNILLEIPREVVQAPAEILTGRDLSSSHYLGRAQMYKTEGGEEQHGFFRGVLGFVDVLNLLPDPVERYFDPSQFPDHVKVGSLKPGEILAGKTVIDVKNSDQVKFGKVAMQRQARVAVEDMDAARKRTLARFNGGVEETYVTMNRGREGLYQESRVSVRANGVGDKVRNLTKEEVWERAQAPSIKSGDASDAVVENALKEDSLLAGNPAANGGQMTVTASPGALFVDKVSRQVKVYLGAAAYNREAEAMNGFAGRLAVKDKENADAADLLAKAKAKAAGDLEIRTSDRDNAVLAEQQTWNAFHVSAERIGLQAELEKRIAAAQAEITDLKSQLDYWASYPSQLDPTHGAGLFAKGHADLPWSLNLTLWKLALALSGLGALLAALWRLLRRRARPAN
ncbi:MAG: cell envelope integrity protein TolA [Elusimicrobiota bacterium]